MAEKDIDLKKIKELIEIMKQNGLEELEIKYGDDKIYLKKNYPQPVSNPIITSIPMMKHDSISSSDSIKPAGNAGYHLDIAARQSKIKGPHRIFTAPGNQRLQTGKDDALFKCIFDRLFRFVDDMAALPQNTLFQILHFLCNFFIHLTLQKTFTFRFPTAPIQSTHSPQIKERQH